MAFFNLLDYGREKRETGQYGYHNDQKYGNCGTIEDCFNLPCPTYGFAVRYTFTRNIPNNGINPRAAEVPFVVKNEVANSDEPNITKMNSENDQQIPDESNR